MLFYKSIDSPKVTDKIEYGFRWSDIKGFKFLNK